MELDLSEALRYLGITSPAPEPLFLQLSEAAQQLTAAIQPRYTFRVFPLLNRPDGILLSGTGLLLTGRTAQKMLAQCTQAALLACTLGSGFDTLLRTEQARDMSRAVLLDACGSVWVEAGCDQAERELVARFPGRFFTDRFSPGYGDLPLDIQPAICTALDTHRRLGLHVTDSLLLNPVKSVTAVIGLADRPQMARVRGCSYCSMNQTCALRKGGKSCAI